MTELELALHTAEELTKPWGKNLTRPENNRLDVVIEASDLISAVQGLLEAHWGYLAAISGLDRPAPVAAEGEPQGENAIEALYTFCSGSCVLNLRVSVPYSMPNLPTVCGLIPSATLYERELMEMFGVLIDGTPDTSRLILADAWPKGVYPLRKSFTGTSPADAMEGASQ